MIGSDWKRLAGYLAFFLSLPLITILAGAVINAPSGHLDLNSGTFVEIPK